MSELETKIGHQMKPERIAENFKRSRSIFFDDLSRYAAQTKPLGEKSHPISHARWIHPEKGPQTQNGKRGWENGGTEQTLSDRSDEEEQSQEEGKPSTDRHRSPGGVSPEEWLPAPNTRLPEIHNQQAPVPGAAAEGFQALRRRPGRLPNLPIKTSKRKEVKRKNKKPYRTGCGAHHRSTRSLNFKCERSPRSSDPPRVQVNQKTWAWPGPSQPSQTSPVGPNSARPNDPFSRPTSSPRK